MYIPNPSTLLLLFTLSTTHQSQAAFTTTVTSLNDTSSISPSPTSPNTFCFYPAPPSQRTILPAFSSASCTGPAADLRAVLSTHLAQSASSIAYYGADLTRLGGAEYLVAGNTGKVYLCVSGWTGEEGGLYETSCEVAERDNMFGRGEAGNRTVCSVEEVQAHVDDGCYVPGLELVNEEDVGSSAVQAAVLYRSALWIAPVALYTLASHLL